MSASRILKCRCGLPETPPTATREHHAHDHEVDQSASAPSGRKAYPLGASYSGMQRFRLVEFADRGFDAAADLVEIFFRIRRGTSTSVKDLISAIETLIGGGNERCEQFVWTKPADDIVNKATQGHTTSIARHQEMSHCPALASADS
jgi:hypothetical protein